MSLNYIHNIKNNPMWLNVQKIARFNGYYSKESGVFCIIYTGYYTIKLLDYKNSLISCIKRSAILLAVVSKLLSA